MRAEDGRLPQPALTRRRVLGLVAATSSVGLAGAAGALLARPMATDSALHRWRGVVMGAEATLAIHHPDAEQANRLLAVALTEIERLENIFSLYREDSALARLNRDGRLEHPPIEMTRLLGRAQRWGEITDGAFDMTVQPLWALYRDHFSKPNADPGGPPDIAVAAARRLVDYRAIKVNRDRIILDRPGMAVTLNGIAQGDITDRVAERLRADGLQHSLIDLGEIRALDTHPAGRPWQAGIKDPNRREQILTRLDLTDRALATSAVTGTQFDGSGRHHHLFDPKSGRPSQALASASVVARRARDADAFSTALVAGCATLSVDALREFGIEQVLTVDAHGVMHNAVRPRVRGG